MDLLSSIKPPKVVFFIHSGLALSSLDQWINGTEEGTDRSMLQLMRQLWLVQLATIAQKHDVNLESVYPTSTPSNANKKPRTSPTTPLDTTPTSISLLATDFDAREVRKFGASSTPLQPHQPTKLTTPISPVRAFPTLSSPNGATDGEITKKSRPSVSVTIPLTDSALIAYKSTILSRSDAKTGTEMKEGRKGENIELDAFEETSESETHENTVNTMNEHGDSVESEIEGGEAQSTVLLYDPLPTVSTIMPLTDDSLIRRPRRSKPQPKELIPEKRESTFPNSSSTPLQDESVMIISPPKGKVNRTCLDKKISTGRIETKLAPTRPTHPLTSAASLLQYQKNSSERTSGLIIRLPSHLVEECKKEQDRASGESSCPNSQLLDDTIKSESALLTQEEVNVKRRGRKKILKRKKIHTHDASDSDYEPGISKA